ncbi:MAG: VWA domain-containing protein [Firmicutes bacterium]|nr:VWA domain-containing protein [Bacillota bacterium]
MRKSFSKKIISSIIVLVMMFSVIPANVIAYDILLHSADNADQNDYAAQGISFSIIQPDTAFQPMSVELNFTESETTNTVSIQNQSSSLTRYTILVLDVSSAVRILDTAGNIIFIADPAVEYVKAAATSFIEQVGFARGTNYVAIVVYAGTSASVLSDFTTDTDVLRNAIAEITFSPLIGRSIAAGLNSAYALLNNIQNPDAIKNVILFTTGMTDSGEYNFVGRYNSDTIGSRWRNQITGIPIFAYANVAYEAARNVDRLATLYSIGLFQNIEGIPEEGHDIAQLVRLIARDLASSDEHFFEVEDPNNIRFVFGEIGDKIFGDSIPIIVIPGIAGSNLRCAVTDDTLWLSAWDLLPLVTRIPRLAFSAWGESINNISVGQVYGISDHPITGLNINQLLPYANIMRDLRAAFPDRTVHFFGYDWRMCNIHTANLLYQFVNRRNYERIDIVAHSMGGLVAAQFIANGNGDRIHNLVTVGTPYLGSPKVPYIFLTGNLARILPPHTDAAMRRVSSHLPAVYQLLPFQKPPEQYPYLAVRTGGIFNRQRTYIYAFTHAFMENPNNFNMLNVDHQSVPVQIRHNFFLRSSQFMNGLFLSDGRHVIQTVNYYVITGTGSPTIRTTVVNTSGNQVETLSFSDGDGTVPYWSASIGGRVNTTSFRYAHLDLIFRENVINHVIGVLNHNVPPGAGVTPSHPGTVVIRIASPVQTTIRFGDEVLSSKEAYFNRVTSFGSLHFIGPDGSVELFALATDKIYDVLIAGTGYGTMTYSIAFYDTNGDFVEERIFVDVPITYDTIITTNTGQSVQTTLNVDTNGDGVYDFILFPCVPLELNTTEVTITNSIPSQWNVIPVGGIATGPMTLTSNDGDITYGLVTDTRYTIIIDDDVIVAAAWTEWGDYISVWLRHGAVITEARTVTVDVTRQGATETITIHLHI